MTQPIPTTQLQSAPERGSTLAIGICFVVAVLILRAMGRIWWCRCGEWFLWTTEAYSPHTSQHLLDPYSITHVLHGFVFWWIVHYSLPLLTTAAKIALVVAIEAAWEILENTPWVIDRYRQATAALGYEGDSIINALGDIAFCWLGAQLARRLGFRWSLALFVATELALAVWIRDGLTLNVVMLLWPSDALQRWQMGQ
jgi:hypothetical protein